MNKTKTKPTKVNFRTQLKLLMLRKGVNTPELAILTGLCQGMLYKYQQEASDMLSCNLAKCFNALYAQENKN